MPDDLRPPPESAGLSPCPFCGNEARPSSRNGLTFFVECQTSYCAIVGPERCASDAVAAWNRRAALTITPDDPKQVECVARELFDQHYTYEDDSSPEWRDQYWQYAADPALEHKGDCPHAEHKGPITCDRCVVDEWRERARAALKALSDAREKKS